MLVNGGPNAVPPVGGDGGLGSAGKAERPRRPSDWDVVEISSVARDLSASKAEAEGPVSASLDLKEGTSRIRAEIGTRLKDGFYESEEILTVIAGKILDLLGL